jgi:hypothetical protein
MEIGTIERSLSGSVQHKEVIVRLMFQRVAPSSGTLFIHYRIVYSIISTINTSKYLCI